MSKASKHGLKGSSMSKEMKSSSKNNVGDTSMNIKPKGQMHSTKRSKSMHSKSDGSQRGLKVLKRNFLRHECGMNPGTALVYIPVFEAREIHVLSFYGDDRERIDCPPDVTIACQTVPL
jgi:hypothetical protein